MTTFSDIFKSSFLENVASVSLMDMLITMALAFGMGVFIFFVYKKTYSGVMYSASFGATLVALTMITSMTILAVTSNVVLSLGMVGALSIVRFRTAVKDPMDTAYMFWALTMGILLGAGLYVIALVVVLGISVFVLLMTFVKVPSATSYLLVLHCDDSAMQAVQGVLARIKYRRMRSKTVTQNGTEMTVEVRISERQDLVGQLLDIPGVYDATLVSCQSEAGA